MRWPRLIQFTVVVCAASFVSGGCSSARISPGSTTGTTPSPTPPASTTAAYVYVTSLPTAASSTYEIRAYAADGSGQLAPLSGSPFNQSVASVTASGGYLVASTPSQPDINSYKIGSNGTLTLASQLNYAQQMGFQSSNDTTCSSAGGFIFDRSGQSMYAAVGNYDCSNNNAIASFAFNSSNGSLSYLGNVNIGYESSAAISVLGNNNYAYSALFDACMYGGISSFARESNGLLNDSPATITPEFGPSAPSGATSSGVSQPIYRPGFTAADTTNHVAMAEYPCFAVGGVDDTQVQLATYTADENGNLSTADTSATMPTTTINPQRLEMSPSGTLLAVGGTGGLQVFHFNGANPITSFTGVLTTDTISQILWDNSNHLYALSQFQGGPGSDFGSGKLHVFTITDTGASEAPGSPYTIAEPMSLAVQPESSN